MIALLSGDTSSYPSKKNIQSPYSIIDFRNSFFTFEDVASFISSISSNK